MTRVLTSIDEEAPAGTVALGVRVGGDAANRLEILGDGTIRGQIDATHTDPAGTTVTSRLVASNSLTVPGFTSPARILAFETTLAYTSNPGTKTAVGLSSYTYLANSIAWPNLTSIGSQNLWTSAGTVANGTTTLLTGVALQGLAAHNGTGTITTLVGSRAAVQNGSTGTITNAYGIQVIAPSNVSGTLVNTNGLRIESQTVGTQTNQAYGINQVGTGDRNFFGGPVSVPVLTTTGLTGATAASRYVGATASGAPASGTFAVGDYAIDQAGTIRICTVAGTPGTWTAPVAVLPLTGSVAATSTVGFGVRVSGDAQDRLQILGDGTVKWGSGAAVGDTTITRYSQGLTTDRSLWIKGTGTGSGTYPLRVGSGAAYGAPTTAPTLTDLAVAGNVNGVVQYAYLETDTSGSTMVGPAASIVVVNSQVRVVIPGPRRGVSSRKLYRTVLGGSTFKLLHDFGGGDYYFSTTWTDNVADASLGADAPASDTSGLYNVDFGASVKYLRSGPEQGTAAADLTLLTGVSGGTVYGIDSYAPMLVRTDGLNGISSRKTGQAAGAHFYADWLTVVHSGQAPSMVFQVLGTGRTEIKRFDDGGPSLYVNPQVALTTAGNGVVMFDAPSGSTQPLLHLVPRGTGSNHAIYVDGASGQTSALVQLQTAGTGSLLRDGNNRFRIQSTGVVSFHNQAAGTAAMTIAATSDSNDRLVFTNDGILKWGSGAATPDVTLSRTGAAAMTLSAGGLTLTDTSAAFALNLGATNGAKIGATSDKIGFLGKTPVIRRTVAAAATDLATVITLANDLRTALIDLGLAA